MLCDNTTTPPSCKQYSLDRVLDYVQMNDLITQKNNSIYECESGGIADKPVPSNQTRVPELPHVLFKL